MEAALVNEARREILERIRSVLGPSPAVPLVPRDYRRAAGGGDTTTDLFCARAGDYRATVQRCSLGELDRVLAGTLTDRGIVRLVAAPAMPAITAVDAVPDDPGLPARELDTFDGVLTGCALAIAETGTIVLDGSPLCGRRALTLVPDYHLCVVRAEQIVHGVPEAIEVLEPAARRGQPITLVSGPSATSDIELSRVEGVHGPRTLDIVVVAET
ncbi:MAG: LutC/YkgG family protein [Gaiellaceae bacterium]